MPYKKLGELEGFTIVEFVKKYWSNWNEQTQKFERSDDYQQGFSPKYSFKIDGDDMLDLSQAQLGQALVGAFEAKKPITGCTFMVKTNGQTGKEIRYYINYDFKGLYATTPSMSTNSPNVPVTNAQAINMTPSALGEPVPDTRIEDINF